MDKIRTAVIIVNWNGKEYLKDCLETLHKQTFQDFCVIFVDNGSTDDSISFVKDNYPQVQIIRLSENYGFAKANNIGIKKACNDYPIEFVVLLNNDTSVTTQWLQELISAAEKSEKDIGIFSSKILEMDNPHIIDSTGYIFKYGELYDRGYKKRDKNQYDDKTEIKGACAAACLYKRTMLDDIGLFDETYITYYEDKELSLRANTKGWKGRYVPEAVVYHKGGGTSTKTKEFHAEMIRLWLKNAVKTLKVYATFRQKSMFALRILLIGLRSGCGKLLHRNNVGMQPYKISYRDLFKTIKKGI